MCISKIKTVLAAFAVLVFFALTATGQSSTAQEAQPKKPHLTTQQIAELKRIVLPALKERIAIHENEQPSRKELLSQFQKCEITEISLGTAGTAIQVESHAEELGSGNGGSGFNNLYLFRHGKFELLMENAGWREVQTSFFHGAPDILQGWSAGYCHATYTRYRFHDGTYQPDACNQQVETSGGHCGIVKCAGSSLPVFNR